MPDARRESEPRRLIDKSMLVAERIGVTRTSAEGLCSWRGRATPRSGGDPRGGHRFADPSPSPAPPVPQKLCKARAGAPPFPSKRPAPRACIHRPRFRGENVNRAMFTTQDPMFTNAQELGRRRAIRAGRRLLPPAAVLRSRRPPTSRRRPALIGPRVIARREPLTTRLAEVAFRLTSIGVDRQMGAGERHAQAVRFAASGS